ncbi:MAG: hypothetical protein IPG76_23915 [Acidobacteria bacterium]|nr:hypothetical protein [Acidobacteriota bacterium]
MAIFLTGLTGSVGTLLPRCCWKITKTAYNCWKFWEADDREAEFQFLALQIHLDFLRFYDHPNRGSVFSEEI